jgi:hypothetical protein
MMRYQRACGVMSRCKCGVVMGVLGCRHWLPIPSTAGPMAAGRTRSVETGHCLTPWVIQHRSGGLFLQWFCEITSVVRRAF